MDALGQLLARDQIRQLAERYAVALDARDMDALVELFVPDVHCGSLGQGRDALRQSFESQLRGSGPTVLFVGNHVIDFDDASHAHGIVYCLSEAEQPEGWVRQAIQYHDLYSCLDGNWYFVRRKHLLWYGVIEAVNPLDQAPAEWPKHQYGRGTVPECLESWRQFQTANRSQNASSPKTST